MTQMAQVDTTSVILKTEDVVVKSHAEEKFRTRKWSFTLNNYTEEEMTQMTHFSGKLVFSKETGESGTPHLQGYIELKNARTLSGLKKELKINRIHLEPSYKNRQANVLYCVKEGNVIRNDFGKIYTGADLPKRDQLYEWQLNLLDIIENKRDDRTIYWFWEDIGNAGKSRFGKYLCFHYKNICLLTATKSADILTAVDEKYDTYILDFPRTLGPDFCPFTAIEQVKNGFITDSKLKKEARILMFDPPTVIIFSNYPPERKKLSQDRWQIYNIHTNTWEV